MALYQILYWQGIPSQVKAWDDFDDVKVQLDNRFITHIDATAQAKGIISGDDYLAHWKWGEEIEIDGEPEDIAEDIKADIETNFFEK